MSPGTGGLSTPAAAGCTASSAGCGDFGREIAVDRLGKRRCNLALPLVRGEEFRVRAAREIAKLKQDRGDIGRLQHDKTGRSHRAAGQLGDRFEQANCFTRKSKRVVFRLTLGEIDK